MQAVIRQINLAFGSFFFFVALCIALAPRGLSADNGISYYGGHVLTILPYLLAFAVCGYFIWGAASALAAPHRRVLSAIFHVCAVLLFGLVLTPYNVYPLSQIHVFFGTTLFSIEMILAVWIVIRQFDWVLLGLILLQLAGGLASLYYLPRASGYLLQGQVVFQIGFWLLLVHALRRAKKL